ncbi:hypothetical protein BDV41DRAFT_536423 [Aspergillus transmontanensis]|uniref:Uncharacterized protein n=1 Tax=Aspergillus transmontanensis TaxID=1034304 RepID=A0A5N6VZ93_9EURO|nr:hypothetical protein BDV41DRAFT_536423 [Aspergillus transmontanensis]
MTSNLIDLRAAAIVLNVTCTLPQRAATAIYHFTRGFAKTGPRKFLIMNGANAKSGCILYPSQYFGG